MHNASFDIRVTANNFGISLISALHADTQLMKHTLWEEGPFALKDNAIIYAREVGLDSQDAANQEQIELEQNVKANGGKWTKENKQMFKADLDVLSKYAIADTDITLRLYNYFERQLVEQGLHDFFYVDEVMPLYKHVTIKMEHRGVYLDMPMLIEYLEEIKLELEKTEKSVVEALMATSEAKEFVNGLLDEEFPVAGARVKQAFCTKYDLSLPKLASGKYQLTKKSLEGIRNSFYQAYTYLSDIAWADDLGGFDFKAIQMQLLLKDQKYPINIGSKDQLGKIVFDYMKIEPLTKTPSGKGQFNEDFVEHLAEKYGFAWAKELRVFNKLTKIKSSYYDRFMDKQESGIFYPTYQQHRTTSGRYSGDLQQLPRPMEEGSDDPRILHFNNILRALVIPKQGYVYIDDDYASLEPCVFADDAGDQALLDIFINNEDFYSKVAIMALGIKDCTADKKASNFLKNKYPKLRQDAKAYSLGIRYGAKSGKISQLLNISKEEAQDIIDSYFKAFPLLKDSMDKYIYEAKTRGIVTSKFGRVRHLPRLREIYKKFGDSILDYKALPKLAFKHKIPMTELQLIRREYNGLLNNALNFPIQSAANSIISRAAIAMSREFLEKGLDAWISAITHDQAVVSVREDQKKEVAEIVQRCMEKTNTISVPLVAIPQFAYNMRDGH
jgi:DNA polymerase I-like protein with 3'-5' exonuclease and polymerase domains